MESKAIIIKIVGFQDLVREKGMVVHMNNLWAQIMPQADISKIMEVLKSSKEGMDLQRVAIDKGNLINNKPFTLHRCPQIFYCRHLR